ncbi:hypothetical protein BROSI_A3852 [Candidatus Brocadia sinica JPN1]|uniref:Uncharacterized protein n=1 Tax=Candidatus Brocadia sinica JPN1 TaxID=1197129 RepID=A0ABQ0K2K5_9BACT|nr:hypothetical protein BROSI_A3852 [Candidatus Brocadia sinica JPN1]
MVIEKFDLFYFRLSFPSVEGKRIVLDRPFFQRYCLDIDVFLE